MRMVRDRLLQGNSVSIPRIADTSHERSTFRAVGCVDVHVSPFLDLAPRAASVRTQDASRWATNTALAGSEHTVCPERLHRCLHFK